MPVMPSARLKGSSRPATMPSVFPDTSATSKSTKDGKQMHALNTSFARAVEAALKRNPHADLSRTLFPQYTKHLVSMSAKHDGKLPTPPLSLQQFTASETQPPSKPGQPAASSTFEFLASHFQDAQSLSGDLDLAAPVTVGEKNPVASGEKIHLPANDTRPLTGSSAIDTISAVGPKHEPLQPPKPFSFGFQPELKPSQQPPTLFSFAPRPEEIKPFSLGSSAAANNASTTPAHPNAKPFSFGIPSGTAFAATEPVSGFRPPLFSTGTQSVFGSSVQLPFGTTASLAQPAVAEGAEEEEAGEEEEATDARRAPDDDPKLKTGVGEEDEQCLCEQRSKLYIHQDGNWAELGIGISKVKCTASGKSRFIFRIEGVGKTAVNAWLDSNTHATQSGKDMFLSIPQQEASGSIKSNRYLIRTRSSDDTQALYETVIKARSK